MTDDFDDRLLGKLSEEDRSYLESLDSEKGLYAQMADTFAGPMRWWTGFAFVLSFIFFGLCVFAAVRLASAPDLNQSLLWLAGFLWCSLAVAMIKMWFWLRMNQVSLLRELKKIELQISRLNSAG